MKYSKATTKILLLAAVMVVIQKFALALPAQNIAQAQSKEVTHSARISSTTGKVLLKRVDWSDFRPVAVGTELNQGDQIKPTKGARVRVTCPNFYQPFIPAGVPSGLKSICPVWQPIIFKAPPTSGTLGGTNSQIPYLITPRHSLVLSNTPSFTWNPVPNATKYTVKLLAQTEVVWQKQVNKSSTIYPGNPRLRAGTKYSLVITANTGKSSQDEGKLNLNFIVLNKSEIAAIQTEVTKIIKQEASQQVTALMLANFYSRYTLPENTIQAYGLTAQNFKSYSLSADAIATIEALLKQGKQSPIIYRSLGDIYWQAGLTQKATENYLMAIKLAKASEYLEEQTLALFALGEVYAATGNIKQAINSYSQAKNGYILLGDKKRVSLINQYLENLE